MPPQPTTCFAVLGDPVSHSLSPNIYLRIFKELRLPFHYQALEIKSNEFHSQRLEYLLKQGYGGFSVTIPHKTRAFTLAQAQDPISNYCLASNTLVWSSKEKTWHAFNTDGDGAIDALKTKLTLQNTTAIIVGYGGVSAGICAALIVAKTPTIIVTGRSLEKAEHLVQKIKTQINTVHQNLSEPNPLADCKLMSYPIQDLHNKSFLLKNYQTNTLLINCTPIGLKSIPNSSASDHCEFGAIPIPMSNLQYIDAIFDTVYSPKCTPIIKLAQKNNIASVLGYEMFVAQAVKQCKIFFRYYLPMQKFNSTTWTKIRQWIEEEVLSVLDNQNSNCT